MRTVYTRRAALSVLALLAALSPAPAAWARPAQGADDDGNRDVGAMTLLNRRAIDAYKNLNFEESERLLREALDLSQTAGLTGHAMRARTCVNLGMVLFAGFKQREAAIRMFREALRISPEIRLSKGLANPHLKEVFDEALKGMAADIARAPAASAAAPQVTLEHQPIKAGLRGEAIAIEATLGGDVKREVVVIAYRAAGAAVFTEVKLKKEDGGRFSGTIPATAAAGVQVEYYVEARRVDGKRLASQGSSVDPLVVSLVAAPAQGPAAIATAGGGAGAAGGGAGDRNERRFRIALLAGTGLGWASGIGEVTQVEVTQAGIAWASLAHLAPEIGYFVTPHLLLSARGRFQLVKGAAEFVPGGVPSAGDGCGTDGICSPAKAAFAGFLTGTWFFRDAGRALRPYVSLSAGGGLIRHVAQAGTQTDCGPKQNAKCMDTVAGGPFLFGTGIGASYRLTDGAALVVALDALGGLPNFTAQADLNFGLAFRL